MVGEREVSFRVGHKDGRIILRFTQELTGVEVAVSFDENMPEGMDVLASNFLKELPQVFAAAVEEIEAL